jgi:ABC-type Fe3+-hydroxamate transport system substrate-binding protein
MIDRLMEAERLIMELRARLASIEQRVAENTQSVGKVWGLPSGGGSGGGGGAFYCPSIPAIAGGGSGVADVYLLAGGSTVLVTAGATIYNGYASATTAGRRCTLSRNNDGTYLIYGQSCT